MSDQLALPTADAVETFVASLRQRSAPLNTIKSYAHDLRLFVQAVPADLTIVTPEQIQTFLTSDEHHSAADATVLSAPFITGCFATTWRIRTRWIALIPLNRKAASHAPFHQKR